MVGGRRGRHAPVLPRVPAALKVPSRARRCRPGEQTLPAASASRHGNRSRSHGRRRLKARRRGRGSARQALRRDGAPARALARFKSQASRKNVSAAQGDTRREDLGVPSSNVIGPLSETAEASGALRAPRGPHLHSKRRLQTAASGRPGRGRPRPRGRRGDAAPPRPGRTQHARVPPPPTHTHTHA